MANFYGNDTSNIEGGAFVGFYGGEGNDLLVGAAIANEIYGGQGNDILLPSQLATGGFTGTGTGADPYHFFTFQPSGADFIEGGSGSDAIFGADGDDKLYGGEGDEFGNVALIPPNGYVVVGGVYGGDGNDYADGGGGKDLVQGGTGNDELYGGGGDDLIGDDQGTVDDEEAGDDYLNGGTGNNSLRGGAGDDYLVGSDGEDELYGGAGEDNMVGGSDADTFFFGEDLAELDGDRIGDFDRREDDIIDVSAIDAKEGGSDNAFKYIGDDDFSGKGQIAFHNGKLKFNTDNDKGAEAVMFVNTDKLSNGDFEL